MRVEQNEHYVIGISAMTRNDRELSGQGVIAEFWGRLFAEEILARIPDPAHPGEIVAVYTDFESDETGEYRFVLGARVLSLAHIPSGLHGVALPAGPYEVRSTARGPVATVGIAAWQAIWADRELKARRRYAADYELYDDRSRNPQDGIFDIYLGLKA
jgi:predicted transcriptional regulator YdeE